MKAILAGASLFALSAALPPDYQGLWRQFKHDYKKVYLENGNEEQKRLEIFKANVDIIEKTNAKKLSYWLGVNEFSDQTREEFSKTHLGYDRRSYLGKLSKVPFPNITDVAASIDWVARGAVTKVKNQQRCGSCWAFSSTGSLEGALFVATGRLESLSEEQLVQCNSGTDHGCQGGLPDFAFNWVKQNGICSEVSYPYTSGSGITGSCRRGCKPIVTIAGHTDVPSRNEQALMAAVSRQPVSVAIEADQSVFQQYRGGVLDNFECGTQMDHAVLIVGYDQNYWKVKNSWGESWGERGYIRMVRGKNMCGISQQPSYPTGVKFIGPTPSPPSPPSPSPPPTPLPPTPSPPSPSPDPCRGGNCTKDGCCCSGDACNSCCSKNAYKNSHTCGLGGKMCGCKKDGDCVSGAASDCCSGALHHTSACLTSKRCGCLKDGACIAVLTVGGGKKDCCSGVSHKSIKCAASVGFTCGPKPNKSIEIV